MNISNIYLKEFRKRNGIDQVSLAKFLQTSRSFVSLVESGRSKLPDDKIDKIMGDGRIMKGWDVSELNPAFFRLDQICRTYSCGNVTPLDWETGHSILHISPVEMLNIKHGRTDISDSIADAICSQFPEIDRTWLRFGNGTMLQKDNIYRAPEPSQRASNEEEIAFLKRKVQELEEKVEMLLKERG